MKIIIVTTLFLFLIFDVYRAFYNHMKQEIARRIKPLDRSQALQALNSSLMSRAIFPMDHIIKKITIKLLKEKLNEQG